MNIFKKSVILHLFGALCRTKRLFTRVLMRLLCFNDCLFNPCLITQGVHSISLLLCSFILFTLTLISFTLNLVHSVVAKGCSLVSWCVCYASMTIQAWICLLLSPDSHWSLYPLRLISASSRDSNEWDAKAQDVSWFFANTSHDICRCPGV